MPETKTSLADSVREGFTLPEGTADEAEATDSGDTTPGTQGAQAEVDSTDATGSKSETEVAAVTEGTDDLPDTYFEVDLSGLPAEEKQAIMAALKARDDTIGKLLRGASEGEETDGATGAAGETETPPAPMTDEEIIQALNLDPENPFDENAAKVALPLVRGLQSLQATVDQLVERQELEQLDRYWTGELDKLETENGVLPIDRTAVLEFAAANGLSTPDAAYWQIAGPARRQVETLTTAARKRLAVVESSPVKKPTSVRPTAGGGTEEVPTEQPTVRGAVAEAGRKVLRDLGIGD